MWANKCCTDGNIKGSLLNEAPTTEDSNYPPGYIGWTEDGDVYFHIGSGQWVKLSGGGGGGGGVDSINGTTGAITITAADPLKITPSGKNFNITLEETYIKTINGIPPDGDKNFVIDKTDPITITDGTNKVTVGSTGGGGGGVQSIITDNGTATPNASGEIELKGVSAQGTSTSAP